MLTRVLAKELASYNIRVNAIAPGRVKTPLSEFAWRDLKALKEEEAKIPMGKWLSQRTLPMWLHS